MAFTLEQRQAIEHVHGPMLVIAGAGTGKTMVLVERVARLVATGEARPEEILAVTYTDKAATELVKRLAARVGEGLHACTFHSLCYGMLQRAGQVAVPHQGGRRGQGDDHAPAQDPTLLGPPGEQEGAAREEREAAKAASDALERPIPATSVRTGSVPGTHELIFDGAFEQLSLTHLARDRRVFWPVRS